MNRFLASAWFLRLVHFLALLPAAWLLEAWITQGLGANPPLTLELATGRAAISLLVLTLAVTPLARLLGQACIGRARLPLGLYVAAYALAHVLVLVGLDYRFDLALFLRSYAPTPLFWLGLVTLLLLLVLAITSLPALKARLGRHWKPLHRLIYAAALLDLAHYFLAVKGSLLTLSGNLGRPLLYTLFLSILLLVRLLLPRLRGGAAASGRS